MTRKVPSSLPLSKRQKTNHSQSSSFQTIQDLERQITDAVTRGTSLNLLADLLHLGLTADNTAQALKALYALYRVFVLVIRKGYLTSSSVEVAEKKVVRAWIWEKLDKYSGFLCSLLKDEETALRVSSLQILFSLLKHLSEPVDDSVSIAQSSSGFPFHATFFKKIVRGLLICPASPRPGSRDLIDSGDTKLESDVRDLFTETWLNVYADVRWYFLRETATMLSQASVLTINTQVVPNALSILEKLVAMPTKSSDIKQWWIEDLGKESSQLDTAISDEAKDTALADNEEADDWRTFFDDPKQGDVMKAHDKNRRIHTMTVRQQLHSLAAHRAIFTKCWLSLLPLLSSTPSNTIISDQMIIDEASAPSLTTRALTVLHRGVMPHLTRAVMVMDWVAECVDLGGYIGLLALNALFILMQEYNLDYPQFYTRLYAFFDRNVLHLKYRARFFRLTELFLGSTHLPATLLASFLKRLSRLSLSAPPSAIVVIIPFTYNTLKRHPALMSMIHRTDLDGADIDPFDPSETDPTQTNAINSSLWELYSHKHHYHSAVSTLAKIFEEAFTKPNYAMEDFLDHTYGTMFETEVKRKIKKDPAVVEIELKSKISASEDGQLLGENWGLLKQDDIVSRLWKFGS